MDADGCCAPYPPCVDARSRTAVREGWLPGLLLAIGILELVSLGTRGWPGAAALEAISALLLVFRARRPALAVPLSALALSLIPLTGTDMNEPAVPILFVALGLFSLGRRLGVRTSLPALGATLAVLLGGLLVLDPRPDDVTDVMFVLALSLPPFAFGRLVRRLDDQGRQLAEQQEVIAAQAVQAERDRIARELHDVIAHTISAMVVQIAAAQDLLRSDPDRAAGLLESVADTGRGALVETGRLLHLVRDEAQEAGVAPTPSLAGLPALVSSFRERGLEVRADLDLHVETLPTAVDVSTYRIMQEALTNAHRHGRGPVSLRITTTPGCLTLHCSNPAGGPSTSGSGLGLRGMAERAGLLGGEVHTRRDGGRFTLEVAIPLPEAAP